MYNEEVKSIPTKNAEHLSIAEKMGEEIASKFNPEQQNEMVRSIRCKVSERRQLEIEELEKRLAYLKEKFQEL